jgi:hypothetical protein
MIPRRKKKSRIDRRGKPQAYSSNQLRQPIQPSRPRGAAGPPKGPPSSESVTKGLQQNQGSQTQGMLGGLLMGKGAVDNAKELYDTGVDAKKGFGMLGDWAGDKMDGMSETFSGMSMPTMSSFDMSMPDFFSGSGSAMSSAPIPSDFSMVNGNITSLGGDVVGANSAFAGGDMGGLLEGSEGMGSLGGDATTGLQASGSSLGQAMPYLNIGKDLIMGSDDITGNQFGDAALRGGLAYATGGLSELGYSLYNMFS